MIDPVLRFFFLVGLPVSRSIAEAGKVAIEYVRFPHTLNQISEAYEMINREVKASITYAKSAAQKGDDFSCALADEKNFLFLVLQIRERLQKVIDWEYYNQYAKKISKDRFGELESRMDAYFEGVATFSEADFYYSFDNSAINLEYYKMLDFVGQRSGESKYNLYIHVLFLKKAFDRAVDVFQNRLEGVGEDYISKIVHSIQFPPAYYKAGMSILTYFGVYLRKKYPDMNVKVRIEQEGLVVRMIIDTPDGANEVVEKALDEYFGFVKGLVPAEDLLRDPVDVMELKHALEIAQMEVRHQKDLLQFASQKIRSQDLLLENFNAREDKAINYFGELIAGARNDAKEWREFVLRAIETSSGEVRGALVKLEKVVETARVDNVEEFREIISTIKKIIQASSKISMIFW